MGQQQAHMAALLAGICAGAHSSDMDIVADSLLPAHLRRYGKQLPAQADLRRLALTFRRLPAGERDQVWAELLHVTQA